jgi:SAM-dependent methyltransferase
MTRLHLGCGRNTPEGWVNVDYALGARLAQWRAWRYINNRVGFFSLEWSDKIYLHNLLKPLPWDDNSINAVYTSHTLEHFDREGGLRLLRECHRVLMPGGTIRIIVPDLRAYVASYAEGKIGAEYFVEALGLAHGRGQGFARDFFSFFIGFPHRCMYDAESLNRILINIGFVSAPRAGFDSDIPDITSIEQTERLQNAVVVEGRK